MSMMLALLLMQSVAAAAPGDTPATQEASQPTAENAEVRKQIVTIGEKLQTWKGGVYKRDGKLTCRIEEGTGDLKIDAIRCGGLLHCMAPLADRMDAIAAEVVDKADRNRQLQAVVAEAQPCVDAYHVEKVVELARERAGES